jgi:tetratricopeptide (TPR) repeat protein
MGGMPEGVQEGSSRRYAWEKAKPSSEPPRAAGLLLDPHVRPNEDLRDYEARLHSAVSDAEKTGNTMLVGRSLHRLGLHLETLGRLEQAERTLSQATNASDGASSPSNEHLAVVNDHGVVLARLGRHGEAAAKFGQAASDLKTTVHSPITLAAQQNQALLTWVNGNQGEALDLWEAAFQIARETDNASANAQILNSIAVTRMLEGDSDEALQLLNRALLLALRGGNVRSLAFTYNNIGLVFSGPPRGDHVAGVPFVEVALKLLDGPIDVLALLYVLNNNIIVYEQAHLEPARHFRTQMAEALKSFTSVYPRRSTDIERAIKQDGVSNGSDEEASNDEWEISAQPALLRTCARCGVQE